ncbi:MFS transporter [Glycomyces harbinensis]|uniref:MFS transporter, DHA1 family, inner membrane transport protein n=1 Tax=Glycomyces harbinensis TaxID=58114 RepID=A0A1G6X9Y2_9ACTN|nr:MFS transporter [Glycomyces harbinensis]SDD74842.1 MFS transporter, DHA1 family, inner membrane transport protein [Glycomyces harbinensis]
MSTQTTPAPPTQAAYPKRRRALAIGALALGAFGIGLSEFVVVGLLGPIGADLDVSIPTAGLLVTGYAASIAISAPLMTAAGIRLPRKTLLIVLMSLFLLGNVLAAVAQTYGVLMAGRVVAALCHGAYMGVAPIMAASLVAPEQRSRAIALMMTGLTVSTVAGVPFGTALGQGLGWQAAFWAIVVIGAVALLAIVAFVPARANEPGGGLRGELAVFRRPQVWLTLTTTMLGWGAAYAAITFLEPMLTRVSGFDASVVPWLLVLFGIGLTIGNLLGGRLADRAFTPAMFGTMTAAIGALIVFAFAVHHQVPAVIMVFVLGAASFAMVPVFQTRIMDAAKEAPLLASSTNASAFNVGIALSAWLGGVAIDGGHGLVAPVWIGVALGAAALAVAAVSTVIERRSAHQRPR